MKCVLVTNESYPCISGGEGARIMLVMVTPDITMLLYMYALLYRQMGLMSTLIRQQNMLVKFVYFRSEEWNSE